MLNYFKKIFFFLLVVFILMATPFFAQASFWNIIKAWVTINPLAVDVLIPTEVITNKIFKIDAVIINKGQEKIKNLKAEIYLPVGLTLLKKSAVQNAGILLGGKEKKISFRVKGKGIGNYVVVVSVFGELKKELISVQDSATVEVKKETTSLEQQKDTLGFFKTFLNFFQQWFNN